MLQLDLAIFPILETERLILRQLELSDAAEIQFLRSDKSVNEFIGRPWPITIDEAIEFINKINNLVKDNQSVYWAITKKNDPKLMGTICLWNFRKEEYICETGYEMIPAFQGKGFMHEALSEVLRYGFDKLGLRMIEAFFIEGNLNSEKLLQKVGFQKTGELTHDEGIKEIIYSLSHINRSI